MLTADGTPTPYRLAAGSIPTFRCTRFCKKYYNNRMADGYRAAEYDDRVMENTKLQR
jgi:hypothetical protein